MTETTSTNVRHQSSGSTAGEAWTAHEVQRKPLSQDASGGARRAVHPGTEDLAALFARQTAATRARLRKEGPPPTPKLPAGSFAYQQNEKPIKAALEQRLNTTFRKEQIGRRVFDFANEELLIEHSTARPGGATVVARRFEEAARAGDERKWIAIVHADVDGAVRLAELGVAVFDVDWFESTLRHLPPSQVSSRDFDNLDDASSIAGAQYPVDGAGRVR